MIDTRILTLSKADGWTEETVKQEMRIQERVPHSTCEMATSDDPDGWRLTVTRKYPDP